MFLLAVKELESDADQRLRTFDWNAGVIELDETGFVSGPWKIKGAADAHPSAVLRIMPGEDGQWQFVVARPRDVPSFDAVASGAAAPVTPEEEVPTAYDDLRLEREDALKELTDEYDVPDVDLY